MHSARDNPAESVGVRANSRPTELLKRAGKGQSCMGLYIRIGSSHRTAPMRNPKIQALCGNSRQSARRKAVDAEKVQPECIIRTLLYASLRNLSFQGRCQTRRTSPVGARPFFSL